MDEQTTPLTPEMENHPQPERHFMNGESMVPPMTGAGPWIGPPQPMNMMPPYSPDFAIIRDKGRSTLFFVSAVLLLLLTIGQIVYVIIWFAAAKDILHGQFGGVMGAMSDLQYLQTSMGSAIIMNLLVMIPQVLFAIGASVFAFTIRKFNLPSVRHTGLGAVKAGIIITIAALGFFFVMLVFLVVFGIIAGSINGIPEQVQGMALNFVGILIVTVVFMGPVLIYEIQMLNICSRVQEVLRTGNGIRKRISLYVIVFNYFLSAVNVLTIFTEYYDWIGIALTVGGCVVSVLFTVLLQQTRTAMEHWRIMQYR